MKNIKPQKIKIGENEALSLNNITGEPVVVDLGALKRLVKAIGYGDLEVSKARLIERVKEANTSEEFSEILHEELQFRSTVSIVRELDAPEVSPQVK